MDWSNEQYVRLYIRDTKTWLKMRWEGQSLFMMLLRKVDRAGVLDDIDEPVEDLALITGLPEKHVEVGLERLLKLGPVIIKGSSLVIPNFLEANEAPKSDKQRQREYRERRRGDAMRHEEHLRRQKIYRTVQRALENGTLSRKPCEICGKEEVDAHHDDYSKPLDVVWLCREHHSKSHAYVTRCDRSEQNATDCNDIGREHTSGYERSLLPVPDPVPILNQGEGSTRAQTSKDEEERHFVRGTFADKRGTFAEDPGWPADTPATPEHGTALPGKSPDPFATNVDPDNEATASMSGLTKELADAIHETWPDYPHFVTTAGSLRADAEKIPGDWRALLVSVAKRFDPPYVYMGRDQLKKMLLNWFEAEAKGTFNRAQAPSRGSGPAHQSEPTRAPLRLRLRWLDDAIGRGDQIDALEMVDTWNEAVADGVPIPGGGHPAGGNLENLMCSLAQRGRIEHGPGRKVVDHNLPDIPSTPEELLKGPELADPDYVKEQMKGLER